jgi:hypothetical protein
VWAGAMGALDTLNEGSVCIDSIVVDAHGSCPGCKPSQQHCCCCCRCQAEPVFVALAKLLPLFVWLCRFATSPCHALGVECVSIEDAV